MYIHYINIMKVISCCNGADGVEKMVELAGHLDLVFMDVQMPIMDGIGMYMYIYICLYFYMYTHLLGA